MSYPPYSLSWCRRLPHGTCAAFHLPKVEIDQEPVEAPPGLLTPVERDHAATLKPLRRVSWVGGRVALHHAAKSLGWTLDAVWSTPRGAPALPDGLVGSVAHKTRLAVALVDESTTDTLGVDLEELDRPRPKIARMVLRVEERAAVDALPEELRWQAILLRFSIKEAIFKALDPHAQRYIGFQEALVEPRDDGSAIISLNLAGGEGPFRMDAWWSILDDHVLATVRASRS